MSMEETTIQVPRWTPTHSPISSPRRTHVPRWTPSPSPPSSPKRAMVNIGESFEPNEPMQSENFDDSEKWAPHTSGAMKNEGLELELSPPISARVGQVPRWTPSPSPSRSPKGPTRNESFDDVEMGSVASEEDMEKFFPFNRASISSSTRPPPPPPLDSILLEAPSLKNLPKIKKSSKQESESHLAVKQPKENNNNTPWDNGSGFTSKSNGVSLTWNNLWVTVPYRQSSRRPILQRLTGYAQPGQLLAIMGPSGSGKSTLLDALAGKIHGKSMHKDIDQGFGGATSTDEAINILVKAFTSSETCQQVQGRVSHISQQKGGALEKNGSQASFATQCLVLTKRSFVNMYRDLGYYWLRLAIYIALCLCVGTIFYDIGFSYGSIQARGSMLMFVAAFLTFMAIGGFPSFVEDMKIFGRERLNGHYGVGAFVIGNTFSSIPYLVMISLIPGAIAYYLVNLQKGFEHFLYFALLLFVCMMLVESLMMMVASIVPDFLMGIITGAGIQGVMMLCGGFFRLPNDLPNPFWKYPMYYIAFHKYANQGFYKNEFEGLTFPDSQLGGAATITGEEILHNVWQVEMGYSKWIDLSILFGMVVLYRLIFLGIIKTVEKVKPIIRGLFVVSPEKSRLIIENSNDPQ